MAAPTVRLLLSLIGVLNGGLCYGCPSICRCTKDTFQCNRETQLASTAASTSETTLKLWDLPMKQVPSYAIKDLVNITHIEISFSSSLTEIQKNAIISVHSLVDISVTMVNSLRRIEKGAFTDLPSLQYLRIINTGLRHFPDFTSVASLSYINLVMEDNPGIDRIPANSFQGITTKSAGMCFVRTGIREIEAHAFNGVKLKSLVLRKNEYLSFIDEDAFGESSELSFLDVSYTPLTSLPSKGLKKVRTLQATEAFALKRLPSVDNFDELRTAELTYPSHCCAFNEWHKKRREVWKNMTEICDFITTLMELPPVNELDTNSYDYSDMDCYNTEHVKCTPEPDNFNPCEDLLRETSLRSLAWIIAVFAVAGNLAVLLILLHGHRKLTISRFLMCNLAVADLCMGLYLSMITFMDYYSRHDYYNHATDWQNGPGCGTAGFLTVFSSELSVFTLTVISLERWHTITNALHVNKMLRMPHVAAMMAVGWGFSVLIAVLPLLGVSSYSKVSICLPMDVNSLPSQIYVIGVLLLNVLAFLIVCYCYISIYRSVRRPGHLSWHGDTKIAKRMAVLIFTDFLCMAPISFFAISAALKMPLITVSHSKILLILFYPINSLCNPFLYTIFTRSFRKDVFQLLFRQNRLQTTDSGVTVHP